MSLSQGQDQDPSIRLYAELLPNIRQVTLYVSLPISPNNPDTCNNGSSDSSIVLSSDYRRITVAHNKKTAKLNLPAQVSETSRERLGFNNEQKNKGGETSFRLHIDNQQKTEGGGGQGRGHEANEEDEDEVDGVPWSAATLGSETRLRCRQCQNILLRSRLELDDDLSLECGEESSRGKKGSNGRIFKDLPSQNWAEMMDFWHCHKPDEPGHNHGHEHTHGDSGAHQDPKMAQDQNGTVKGYGASNRVVATPGTVLVDVSSFVVAEEDGVGLNKGPPSKLHRATSRRDSQTGNGDDPTGNPGQETPTIKLPINDGDIENGQNKSAKLICRSCGTVLGVEDGEVATGGWRIYKANVSIFRGRKNTRAEDDDVDEGPWEAYPVETIVAAQLLELIEREGMRRFIVHCSDSDDDSGSLVWVFNPDLRYSSSHSLETIANNGTCTSQRAMKVFYQTLSASKVESLLANELGERQSTSLGELDLPSRNILDELQRSLGKSTEVLPVLARKFQEWDVGMINRV